MLESVFAVLGYGLCHQLPERSLFAGGFQLPVCARDTGLYIGFAAALIVLVLLARDRRPSELPSWPVLLIIGLFVGAMAFDGVSSYAGLRTTTNDIRLITGLMTGWGLATLALPMVNGQLWRRSSPERVPSGRAAIGAWLALLLVTFVVTRWLLPLLGVGYPVLVSAAIVATFVTVNLVFVGLMPVFERRAHRLRDAWPQILVAVGLSAAELAAASLLRVVAERIV
ncbi:MAG: DUF2085 domain-containing protein [Coriobacteriia bacterium]|nr:DUF2085 domain-containing protein [Coriobacteriia bacterium]MDP2299080.1 DUF2085 domain-containing protein [Actinomycetota bacterium]